MNGVLLRASTDGQNITLICCRFLPEVFLYNPVYEQRIFNVDLYSYIRLKRPHRRSVCCSWPDLHDQVSKAPRVPDRPECADCRDSAMSMSLIVSNARKVISRRRKQFFRRIFNRNSKPVLLPSLLIN